MRRGSVRKTIRVTDAIVVDLDGQGRLLGIDIDHASQVLGRGAFAGGVVGDELLGVSEAAKLCGVRKPNFLRDYADKPGFPKPAADLAGGRIWLRSDIEAYLAEPGRARRLRHIA
jgi:predicted DNA-binding transcriptional regulator AlpA